MRTFIICPPAHSTGGPEALHQLAYKATSLGFEADLVYLPEGHPDPVAPAYRSYGTSWVDRIDDAPDSLVVVPEIDVPLLLSLGLAHRALWWLSVDNFDLRNEALRRASGAARGPWEAVFEPRARVTHLSQSVYAFQHLARRGASSMMLTDYLPEESVGLLREASHLRKEDIVVYNPAKGMDVTQSLMAQAPELDWVPLSGLDRAGVASLLGRAKVYVDFGNHPGRDRLPREAALAGACVIVGRRGSAANASDVPLPDHLKFDVTAGCAEPVVSRVKEVLADFARHSTALADYRTWVMSQEARFTDEVFVVLNSLETQMRAKERIGA